MSSTEPDNSMVEQLLRRAPTDVSARDGFVRALLDATVVVPGHRGLDGTANPMPFTMRSAEGPGRHPFFTSRAAMGPFLGAVPEPRPVYTEQWMPCREWFRILVQQGMDGVLNPFAPGGSKDFLGTEMVSLLDGPPVAGGALQERTVKTAETWMVGTPAEVPDGLIDALRPWLAGKPSVHSARLAWAIRPDQTAGFLLVLVADAPQEEIVADFGSAGVNDLLGGATMDVMVQPGGQPVSMAGGVEPFYP